MKRTTLLIITALMAVCARSQYKCVMTVGAAETDDPHQVSFNLTSVCKSLGSSRDDLGHILEVWLDPNRSWQWKNEYKQYESLPLIYVPVADGTEKMVSNTHSGFAFMADGTPCRPDTESLDSIGDWEVLVSANPELNQLNFSIYVMPNPRTGELSMKAGDTCHAVFGLEYEGRRATFDLTMHIVEGNGGSDVPLTSLEKVGEGRVAMKYQAGKACRTQLDMAAIAKHFGGDVEGGNLRFYVARQGETGMLTDRYAYSEVPQFKCNEEMAEELDNENPRVAEILFSAETQHLLVNTPGAFSAGEHATGPLYLVADGKYYELVLDVQFGDSEQEAKNMAVTEAAEPCGTFARSMTVSPLRSIIMDGDTVAAASFSLAVLAKALGTDGKTLASAIRAWMDSKDRPDGTEMLYNLSDHATTTSTWGCGNYTLKKNGRVSMKEGEYEWYSHMELDEALGELQFHMYQVPAALKDGDVCHAALGLYYEGRMVTLDLTMNIRDGGFGEAVALGGMKKVGEETVSGKLNYTNGLRHKLDLTEIATHFSSGIEGKNLKLYVMTDPERQLLTDRYAYETTPTAALTIECTAQKDFRTLDYFWVSYSPYPETLIINAPTDAFHGGQHSSGSVFLVAEGEYYELVLDIQFGDENDERESLDVVATEQLDVQLMATEGFFTYYDPENLDSALISTRLDMDRVAELLGTEKPVLFAEQLEADGRVTLTSRYNCAPGQGFWLTSHEGQAYRTAPDEIERLGVYFADGSLRWYEAVYPPMKVGEHYRLNLYLADPESGRAVKYEVAVEFVDKIETPSIAYVHRLPTDLTRNANGVEAIHNAQFIMHNVGNAIYNLQGRKINLPQPLQRRGTQGLMPKGVYIVNGRKVLIK